MEATPTILLICSFDRYRFKINMELLQVEFLSFIASDFKKIVYLRMYLISTIDGMISEGKD